MSHVREGARRLPSAALEQGIAECCSVLQYVAVCGSSTTTAKRGVGTGYCRVLQYVAVCGSSTTTAKRGVGTSVMNE